MKEKQFQRKFRHYLQSVRTHTGAYELKVARGASLPFSALAEHQERALLAAKHAALIFKISDDALGQKPVDMFCLFRTEAFVVVLFGKEFFGIDIDLWCEEKKTARRKSLTKERAEAIATFCG